MTPRLRGRLTCLVAGWFTLLLAGCATSGSLLAGYRAETARYQALADKATSALGASPVTVILKSGTTGEYIRLERRIDVGTGGGASATEWLLAHELSHHILDHDGRELRQEQEANALAVKILMVWGRTEPEAVYLTERAILSTQRGKKTVSRGHDFCAEYRDVVRRYPNLPEMGEGQELCPLAAAR